MKNKKSNKNIVIPGIARIFFLIVLFIFAFTFSFAQNAGSAFFYNSIQYRGLATVEIDNQTQNCQFNLVNVIDSFLYIQLHVAGIEIGRALATPNNVLFVNKLNKEYFDGNYSVFQDIADVEVDFFTLQDIFNGVPVDAPEEIEVSYQGALVENGHPFFKTLILESKYFALALKVEVKKVTFNDVPKVSIVVPKNFSQIIFDEED